MQIQITERINVYFTKYFLLVLLLKFCSQGTLASFCSADQSVTTPTKMLPFKLVLIFQLTSIGLAYWVCDLAGTTCDADDGTEVCFAHFGNSYVTSHKATLFQVGSRLKCAALCLQKKNCRCIVFLKGKNREKYLKFILF